MGPSAIPTILATGAICAVGLGGPGPKPKLMLGGVEWESDWGAALASAKRENKPILKLDLLGRLDEEFC